MKLAYLANVRIPSERAHSTQIVHMCHAFSDNGCEVDLIANKRVINKSEDIDSLYGIKSKFRLIRSHHGYFNPKIKITYYFCELFFSLNFLLNGKTKKYDIILSRSEWIIWFLSFWIPSSRLIWESHEAKFVLPAKRLLKKGIKTVVISEGILDTYKKLSVPPAQMIVAHDGIDESFFVKHADKVGVRKKLGLDLKTKVAMYIGGLDKWKGVETFFEASSMCEEIKFVVVGGSLKELVDLRAKYPSIIFLGQRPYRELSTIQQAADILVVPNTANNLLSEKYTSPLKLFAHMASGLPLVVSNITSLRNIVDKSEVTLFKPDDSNSLADNIKNVVLNYELKKQNAIKLQHKSKSLTWNNRALIIMKFVRS